MSLIIKKNTTFKIPRTGIIPSDLTGLSAWFKADDGVTTFYQDDSYVARIYLNGYLNGMYITEGIPTDADFWMKLEGSNNAYIYFNSSNGIFYLKDTDRDYWDVNIAESTDGENWTSYYELPESITINGSTSNELNGVYNLNRFYGPDNEYFYVYPIDIDYTATIRGNPLTGWILCIEGGPYTSTLYTNNSQIAIGSWTNVNGGGTVTSTSNLFPNRYGTVYTTREGYNIASWQDKSGNNIILIPNIQNGPTFISSFVNGKPAIEFIADDNTGLSNSSFGLTGFTFFSVAKQKPTNTGRIFSSYFGNVLIGTWGNYSNRFYGGGSNGWLAEGTQTSTDFLITTAFSDANTSFGFYQNGILQSNGNSNSAVILNGISVGGGIWNGGNVEASDSYVCEIVIYNRTLSSTERQQVEAYLNQKYQIY
jgi:hypothetical protein